MARGHKLLTKEIAAKLPRLYAQEKLGEQAIAHVKFFYPRNGWTWYATEYNPDTGEFFGLVKGHEDELGYFTLQELEDFRDQIGIQIERDLYFKPKTIAKCREPNS